MKVFISQGHEHGIGLEVLLKSILVLEASEIRKLHLCAFPVSVERTLRSLKLPFEFDAHGLRVCGERVEATWLKEEEVSESFTALKSAMSFAEKGGVLFTLPTSKDQFPGFPGHTEYFRHYYARKDLGMFFSSPELQVLLLTDHIPLRDVPQLSAKLIEERLSAALGALKNWRWPVDSVLVSGFNPHAGESGLIGNEDTRIKDAIHKLRHHKNIKGPYPADTMYLEKKSPNDLLVYLFHDQGLSLFKGLQGFIGANITLGLSYPRVSPDHGTSFGLFGKNAADYRGCEFALKEALKLLKRISNGKNSSHQGKGP